MVVFSFIYGSEEYPCHNMMNISNRDKLAILIFLATIVVLLAIFSKVLIGTEERDLKKVEFKIYETMSNVEQKGYLTDVARAELMATIDLTIYGEKYAIRGTEKKVEEGEEVYLYVKIKGEEPLFIKGIAE